MTWLTEEQASLMDAQRRQRITKPAVIPVGMVWCFAHQRIEPADDPIDFAVSDDWLDYYYRVGVTPRHSANYNASIRNEQVEKEVYDLTNRLGEMERQLSRLRARREPPPQKALPAPRPPTKPLQGEGTEWLA